MNMNCSKILARTMPTNYSYINIKYKYQNFTKITSQLGLTFLTRRISGTFNIISGPKNIVKKK